MAHPLERWPAHHRRLALIGVCAVTLAVTVAGAIDQPLGDRDIVDFELAGSVGEAKEIHAAAIVMPVPERRAGSSLFGRTVETVLAERPCRVIIQSDPASRDAVPSGPPKAGVV